MQTPSKEAILMALDRFVRQRAGLEFGDYGDVRAYRAEQRQITRDLHDYRAIAAQVGWRESITAENIMHAARHAFSGRLSIEAREDGSVRVGYCAGQHFPTEYRRAACAVLAACLWDYMRGCMPAPTLHHNTETGETVERYAGKRAGDWLRETFKREFGARIARRYFD